MTGMRPNTDHQSRLDWWLRQIQRQFKTNLTIDDFCRRGSKPRAHRFAGAAGDLKAGARKPRQQLVHASAQATGTNDHGPARGAPVPSGSMISGAARARAAPLRQFPRDMPPGRPLAPSARLLTSAPSNKQSSGGRLHSAWRARHGCGCH
jgi:hypothetical protein